MNGKSCVFGAFVGFVLVSTSLQAATPSFGDLLARAQDEAAAGKQWSPAGDNVVETSIAMMGMLSQATPAQVEEFHMLLQRQQILSQDIPKDAPADPPREAQANTAQALEGSLAQGSLRNGSPANQQSREVQPSDAPPSQKQRLASQSPTGKPPGTPSPSKQPDGIRSGGGQPQAAQGFGGQLPGAEHIVPPPPDANVVAPPKVANGNAVAPPKVANGNSVAPPKVATDSGKPELAPVPGSSQPVDVSIERLAAEMFARGKDAEAHNNISGARRYYEVAANYQYRGAARALGRLYDPAWLGHKHLGGITADSELAQKWYQRADAVDGGGANQNPETFSTR